MLVVRFPCAMRAFPLCTKNANFEIAFFEVMWATNVQLIYGGGHSDPIITHKVLCG